MLFRNLRSKAKEIAYTTDTIKLHTKVFLFISLFTLGFTISGNAPAVGVVTQLLFNEGSGTTTADNSGNSHTGTLTNGPVWTAGKYGQAINFDGTNDYVNIADHNNFTLDPALNYTWSAWVRSTNLREWSTVLSQTINTSSYFYFYAHSTADPDGGPVTNGISVYWWSNNTNRLTVHSTNNVLTTGQWSYVTVTYDAAQSQNNRFSIYVNGTDVTARNDVSSVGTIATLNPTNIRVASNQPYGEYLTGAIDEVRYYRRLLSVAEIVSDMNTGATGDTQAPTVSITAPAAAATVSGTGVSVTATAADNIGVAGVQFLLDGVNLGTEDITSPYSLSWNTTTNTNGTHTLTARARDAAGNTTISATRSVTVNNADTQAPTISITTPAAAATVSGTGVSVTATAADNIGVAGVQFLLDGVNLGTEDITSPYSVSWNTTTTTNGTHTLTARARDAAGNTTVSATRSVTVNNADTQVPTVSITAPAAAATVSGTGVSVTATAADNIGVVGVQFLLDGVNLGAEDITSPYSISWNTTTTTNGTHTLTARARDAGGNTTVSATRSVIVNNADTQAPTVSITAPAAAATVSGTGVSVTATAADNIGVAGVQFLLDGNNLGTEDLTSPYSVLWNTTTITNGNHVLTARARDAAGNTTVSGQVTVIVNNDTESPVVSISSPLNATTVAGVTGITATATDNISIAGVQFIVDGVNFGAEDLTSPYSVSWNTGTVADGNHTISARARDAAGNSTTSAIITVAVLNTIPDTESPTGNITSPAVDATVSGNINVTANATDNVGVAGVQFLLDGNALGGEDLSAPYSVSWNTIAASNGPHILTARVRDAAGNSIVYVEVPVTVDNDIESPVVEITSPAAGSITGTIDVTAAATDNKGITGVQFLLDGNNFGAEDFTAPYSVSWNTIAVANGNHTLSAKARDAAGNTTTSATIIVAVNNVDGQMPSIAITSPTPGNASGTLNVAANATDNIGVIGVQFLVDGNSIAAEDLTSPYAVSWNTVNISNGTHTLTAVARDAAGNIGTSTAVSVNVNNDIQAPLISITSPASGFTVSGSINVTANASDDIAVVGVQFLLDGNNLGAEDLTAPYTVSWATTAASNGSHILTAKARDAAGKSTTSTPIAVVVSNATNLISAHHFNEGTGTAAADISGNSHNGTLTNGPLWGAGKYGQAINFDGSNDYVNIADHNNFTLDPAQSYTWSAWVKNNSFKEWSTVWSQTINTSTFFYFYAHTSSDPDGGPVTNGVSVYWWSSNSTRLGAHSSNNVLTIGQWSHITITYDASQPQNNRFSIYVNGIDVTVRNDVSSVGTITTINPGSIRIGANLPFGEYFSGAIDEVRYYKRLLVPAEVISDMNTPLGIDNTSPVVGITAPSNGSPVAGTINVTANATDNFGVTGVQFLLDGNNLGTEDITSPFSIAWNTSTVTNGSHILSARARDAAGNITTSASVNVTVNNDTEPPTVIIGSPGNGAVLTGTIDVSADATDNLSIAGVQFLLDGVNLGVEDLSTPYAVSWRTSTVANGTHTLTARARDAAGNITISPPIVVNIDNIIDTESPVVSVTSPSSGNVSGTITVSANASDNVGVEGVQFLLDGNNLGAEDIAAPYSFSWNSALAANGNHIITARARDAAGNTATAVGVNIVVTNTTPVTISGVTVTSITESSAVITWTTNIPANSQIYYGTTTGYGLSTLTDPALVTTHSMIVNGLKPATLHHYQAVSGNLSGISATSPDNVFTTASLAATLGTLNGHTVVAYPAGKPVPWTPNPADGYMTVVALAWNYLLNTVPNDPLTGKPAYYSRSYINPNTQQMVDWPHNPAGLFGMLIESAIKYYNYSGNANVMKLAEDVALWHLDHGMTTATDSWPNVPYSEGQFGSLNYGGAPQDGVGNLEPDKIGELGFGWLQLYRYNGNTRLRDAAIQAGNVLASKVRTGTMNQSPWPFRVRASNGTINENYGSNIIGPVSLLDGLIADGLGNTAAYQTARTTAWNWMMTYPMQNNIWTQYFEDVGIEPQYDHNLNQYNPMMVARYLLEHPEMDPNWQAHVRGLITWVETIFGQTSFGALAIREQTPVFALIMGSHTSRYASVNALLYERTGDLAAKEKAYRSFNWSTYMARSTGVVIDGPDVNNQWFTDGYGDYIRHFMTGVGAVPEWTPANETHLLRSTSVVKNISYGVNSVNYTTYNANAVDVLHINFNPFTVTADGVVLQQRSDLSQPGWTLDVATKALRIYHNNATQISISWAGTPSFITKSDLHNNQSQDRRPVNSSFGESAVLPMNGRK